MAQRTGEEKNHKKKIHLSKKERPQKIKVVVFAEKWARCERR